MLIVLFLPDMLRTGLRQTGWESTMSSSRYSRGHWSNKNEIRKGPEKFIQSWDLH